MGLQKGEAYVLGLDYGTDSCRAAIGYEAGQSAFGDVYEATAFGARTIVERFREEGILIEKIYHPNPKRSKVYDKIYVRYQKFGTFV
jgi:ribulose kinase